MSILILGDLYYGYDYLSEDILKMSEYIKKNNMSVILNLEGAITKNKSFLIKKRGEHLAQSNEIIKVLKLLNVKGVSISNNHIYDFGEQGLKDTIDILDENKIKHCGAGLTEKDAKRPMIIEENGIKYEFYGATDPFEESICCKNGKSGCLNIENLTILDKRKDKNIKKIALLHTGFEYNTLPSPRTIRECRSFIDSGFYCVICSHPHITQPYEVYKEKNIYYSLGNFYFSTDRDEFQEKKIYGEKEGYCNIGLGVLIDGDIVSSIGISYDSLKKLSYFDKNILPRILKYDNVKLEYSKKYMKCRNNYNPMLTGNIFFDNVKIFFLNCAYKIYRVLKNMRLLKRGRK